MDAEPGKGRAKKRTITPARREQNRLAQRLFRQRQKEIRSRQREASRLQPAAGRRIQPKPAVSSLWPTPAACAHSACDSSGDDAVLAGPLDDDPASLPSLDVASSLLAPLLVPTADSDSCAAGTGLVAPASSETTWEELLAGLPPEVPAPLLPQTDEHQHSSSACPPSDLLLRLLLRPADPLRNTLQLAKVTALRAALHNALCLGLDLARLADCPRFYLSPFYRGAAVGPEDDPAAVLAAATDPAVPLHLRPTLAQVLVPHHACIDVLPLPRLRERAILLGAAQPARFNLAELKIDIYGRNALSCWQQDSTVDNNGCPRTGGTGQPWDMHSWEAAPWFLKKWRLVVGGESGDFALQSQRWRAIEELQEAV